MKNEIFLVQKKIWAKQTENSKKIIVAIEFSFEKLLTDKIHEKHVNYQLAFRNYLSIVKLKIKN